MHTNDINAQLYEGSPTYVYTLVTATLDVCNYASGQEHKNLAFQLHHITSSFHTLFIMSSFMISRDPWIRSSRLRLTVLSREEAPSPRPLIASSYALW